MTTLDGLELALLREDLAYHQVRVLLLVDAVSTAPGHAKKLDGLTKLAKLDFLVRYPAFAPVVLENLDGTDARLHLTDSEADAPTDDEAPMMRYKYGPWDDKYYAVIGALIGRGLLKYARGRKGSVALAPTSLGHELARTMSSSGEWSEISDRCSAIADASSGLTGNALKELIYERLATQMDRPHRQAIR
jgi:hypothetical protein